MKTLTSIVLAMLGMLGVCAPVDSMLGTMRMKNEDFIPSDARFVEYLKSEGTGAYIDFGFPLNATMSLFALIGSDTGHSKSIISSGIKGTASGRFSFDYERIYSKGINRWIGRNRNENVIYLEVTAPFLQFVECEMTPTEYKIDDLEVPSIRKSVADANNIIFWEGMIKQLRVEDRGCKIHDFRPIAIGDEGYMLDLIGGEIYGNAGEGEFIIGPDLIEEEW